jgi:hypothetical protein
MVRTKPVRRPVKVLGELLHGVHVGTNGVPRVERSCGAGAHPASSGEDGSQGNLHLFDQYVVGQRFKLEAFTRFDPQCASLGELPFLIQTGKHW